MAHPDMKALTKEERPGHQKSLSSRALVWKRPACPVVGELCTYRPDNGLSLMWGNIHATFEVQMTIGHVPIVHG